MGIRNTQINLLLFQELSMVTAVKASLLGTKQRPPNQTQSQ